MTSEEKRRLLVLLHKKVSYKDIQKEIKVSKATISYHAKKNGFSRPNPKRIDWSRVSGLLESGQSIQKVASLMDVSRTAIYHAAKHGKINFSFGPPNNYMSAKQYGERWCGFGTRVVRSKLKMKLLREGAEYACAICGISEWNGMKLGLRLDHINGKNGDHRLENLRLICPNCDSQLPTYCHRNAKPRPHTQSTARNQFTAPPSAHSATG